MARTLFMSFKQYYRKMASFGLPLMLMVLSASCLYLLPAYAKWDEALSTNIDQHLWTLALQQDNGYPYIKVFIPQGQTLNNWQELISMQFSPDLQKKVNARQFALLLIQRVTKKGAVGKILSGTDNDVIYEFKVFNQAERCKYEVGRVVTTQKGLHELKYDSTNSNPSSRAAWLSMLKQARIATTATLGPLSLYCQKLQAKFITCCKSKATFNEMVIVDFCLDRNGNIKQVQTSADSKGSEFSKKEAIQLVLNLKRFDPPPLDMQYPLWLSVDLCSRPEDTSVSLRDLDFQPYMIELQHRVKSHWFPPKDDENKSTSIAFKVFSDGHISDLKIDKSSGAPMMDKAALEAVQNSAPFKALPDGSPDHVDVRFKLDYNASQDR